MLVKARIRNRNDPFQVRYVDVEVPDAGVLCQLDDVRVVTTYEHYQCPETDTPELEEMKPEIVVERRTGFDALGVEQWKRVGPTEFAEARAISSLARMLYDRISTFKPSDLFIVGEETAARG